MKNWLYGTVVVVLALLALRGPTQAQSGDMTLVPLVNGWNIGSTTNGMPVLSADFAPSRRVSAVRIGVVLGTTSTLSIRETDGTNTFTSLLNNGTALTAGTMYTFVWECRSKQSKDAALSMPTGYNFIPGTTTTVPILRVTEVTGAVD